MICTGCDEYISSDQLVTRKYASGNVSYRSKCRKCENKRVRESTAKRRNNPQVRIAQRVKMYNISVEDYRNMLARQCGMCGICQVWLDSLRPNQVHIDHDHETNQVRSVLCCHCNRLLGSAKDNAETLRRAINYLGVHKRKEVA